MPKPQTQGTARRRTLFAPSVAVTLFAVLALFAAACSGGSSDKSSATTPPSSTTLPPSTTLSAPEPVAVSELIEGCDYLSGAELTQELSGITDLPAINIAGSVFSDPIHSAGAGDCTWRSEDQGGFSVIILAKQLPDTFEPNPADLGPMTTFLDDFACQCGGLRLLEFESADEAFFLGASNYGRGFAFRKGLLVLHIHAIVNEGIAEGEQIEEQLELYLARYLLSRTP